MQTHERSKMYIILDEIFSLVIWKVAYLVMFSFLDVCICACHQSIYTLLFTPGKHTFI